MALTSKQERKLLAAVGRGYLVTGQRSRSAETLSLAWDRVCREYRWPRVELMLRVKTADLFVMTEYASWSLLPGQGAVADFLCDAALHLSWQAKPRRDACGGWGNGLDGRTPQRWTILGAERGMAEEALQGFLGLLREAERAHHGGHEGDPQRWWLTRRGWPVAVVLRHNPPPRPGAGRTVCVLCPLCGEVHTHGDGDGHRVAHCLGDFPPGGYIIAEAPERLWNLNLPVEFRGAR